MKKIAWAIWGGLMLIPISSKVCAETKQEVQHLPHQIIAEKKCNSISGIYQFMGDVSAIAKERSQSKRDSIVNQLFGHSLGRGPEWVEIIHKPIEGVIQIKMLYEHAAPIDSSYSDISVGVSCVSGVVTYEHDQEWSQDGQNNKLHSTSQLFKSEEGDLVLHKIMQIKSNTLIIFNWARQVEVNAKFMQLSSQPKIDKAP